MYLWLLSLGLTIFNSRAFLLDKMGWVEMILNPNFTVETNLIKKVSELKYENKKNMKLNFFMNEIKELEVNFFKCKPHVSRKTQIHLLKKRNLAFKNSEELAENILLNVPYYKLINGFKENILNNNNENYTGYDFDDLMDLYNFDRKLSLVIFKYILLFEESFTACLSDIVSKCIGYKEKDYLDELKYNQGSKTSSNKTEREIVFNNINTLLSDKKKIILHYQNKHSNVPPWILFQHLDFGNKKFFYKICRENVKKDIMKHYYDIDSQDHRDLFMFSLNMMNNYRNAAAHGDIISNENYIHQPTIKKVSYIKSLDSSTYKYKHYNRDIGVRGLFSLLLCMNRLFRKRNTVKIDFLNDINDVIEEFSVRNPKLFIQFKNSMNFPHDYKDLLKDKLVYKMT